MTSSIIIKIKNKYQEIQNYQLKTGAGKTLHIQATPEASYQLIDEATGFGPEKILVKRVGDDLLISLDPEDIAAGKFEQADLVIENYYSQGDGLVVGQKSTGEMFSYLPESQQMEMSIPELAQEVFSVEVLSGTQLGPTFWLNPQWFLGVAATGGLVAAVSSSGSSGSSRDTTAPVLTINDTGASQTATPSLSGTAEAGSKIEVTVGGKTYTTTAGADGKWSIVVSSALPEGNHDVEVKAIDASGNITTKHHSLLIDTTAPVLTINDTGASQTATPSLSGTAEVGSKVEVIVGGKTYTTTAGADGTWSITVDSVLPEGRNEIVVKATDEAGNTTTENRSLLIDTQAPELVVDEDGVRNDVTSTPAIPMLGGTAEAGSEIVVTIAGKTYTTTTGNDGKWSVAMDSSLPQGANDVVVQAIDAAGNKTEKQVEVFIDTIPPAVSFNNEGIANTAFPSLSGRAEPGSTVQVTVDGKTYTTQATQQGKWSVAVNRSLPEGEHAVTVTAIDEAGNRGVAKGVVRVDSKAPDVSPNDAVSNNETPTLTGTAEVGSQIDVTVSGKTYSTKADEYGRWSITTDSLPQGEYDVAVTATDEAGNKSKEFASVTVDTTPPEMSLDEKAPTSVTTPTLRGTAEANSSIQVVVDGIAYSTTTDALGNWSVPVSTPLSEGEHAITATATDDAGNQTTKTGHITIDSSVPNVSLADESPMKSTTPVLRGTAEPGSTVEVTVDGKTYSIIASQEGVWSIPTTQVLEEGSHEVVVKAIDEAGNSGTDKANLVIDTSAPNVSLDDKGATNSTTPVLSGTAEPGSQVKVTVDGETYTTTANKDGVWSVPTTQALSEGSHDVVVTATDAAGNSRTEQGSLVVDMSAPELSVPPMITNDTTPEVTGTADPGSKIEVTINGKTYTTTAGTDGKWSVSVDTELPVGNNAFTVKATDNAGNISTTDSNLTVDLTAPEVTLDRQELINTTTPTLSGQAEKGSTVAVTVGGKTYTTVANDQGEWSITVDEPLAVGKNEISVTATDKAGNTSEPVTGSTIVDTSAPVVKFDNQTSNDTTPTLRGTAEPGSEVKVTIGDKTYTTTAGDDGKWSVTVSPALIGNAETPTNYPVSVTATDKAGNSSTETGDFALDLTPPTVSLSEENAITSAVQPTLSGTAEKGSTVTVTVAGNTYTTTADENGNWSIDIPATLAEGKHDVTVKATDAAGNSREDTGTITVDTKAPAVSLSDITTNQDKPTLTGTAEPNSHIVVTIDGNTTYETDTDATGKWTLPITAELTEDSHLVDVKAIDDAGNEGKASASLVIDKTAPKVTVDNITTNSDTPVLRGTAEPGSTVNITLPGKDEPVSVTADKDGNWELPLIEPLSERAEPYQFSVTATDAAGNTSAPVQGTVTVDKTAPEVTLTNTAAITNDSTPIIRGTAEPGSKVEVTVNGKTYTTYADDNQSWVVIVEDTLPERTEPYEVSVIATDAAGNSSAPVAGQITVDQTAPGVRLNDDNEQTNAIQPTLSGTAEKGSTVKVTVEGNTYTTTAGDNGTWSVKVGATLAGGPHDVVVTAVDSAGNESQPEKGIVTIDTKAPIVQMSDLTTNDTTPVISGTAEKGNRIVVTVGDKTYTTTAGDDGQWSITVDPALGEGTYGVIVKAYDAANNEGQASGQVIIDTTAPQPTVDNIATNDTTPTLTGKAEAGNTVKVTVGGKTYETTADKDGNWQVTVEPALSEGDYPISVVATDAAGNTSAPVAGNVKVDTTAPDVSLNNLTTNDTTPALNGTAEAGSTVKVTVGGKTYTTTAGDDGKWSVTVDPELTAQTEPYKVTAEAIDKAGNSKTITRDLTIDTTEPTIDVTSPATTKETQPTISGTTEPGSSVEVTVGGKTYTTKADSSGNWSVGVTSTLNDGVYPVVIKATDTAGNTTTKDDGSITIDTDALLEINDIAPSNSTTSTPVSGKVDPGSSVTVTLEGKTYTPTVKPDGTWSIDVDVSQLGNGDHTVTVTAKDTLGNVVTKQDTLSIDRKAPEVGIDSSGFENTDTPTLKGTAEAGSKVVVKMSDGTTYQTTATSSGEWEIPVTKPLSNGEAKFTVTAEDGLGNKSEPQSGSVTIDTEAPTVSLNDAALNTTTPTLRGTVDDPNSTVVVNIGGKDYPAKVAADGSWSVTVDTPLEANKDYPVTVTATDSAKNSSTDTATITIDTTAPSVTKVLIDGQNSGTVALSNVDKSATVTIEFSENPYIDGVAITTGTVLEGLLSYDRSKFTISGLTNTDNKVWIGTLTATDNTSVTGATVKVQDNTFTDKAGNNGTGLATGVSINSDLIKPTLTEVKFDKTALKAGETSTVTFTFSEAVTGIDVNDFSVTNGSLTNIQSSAGNSQASTQWTATFTPDSVQGASGSVKLETAPEYTDVMGNSGDSSSKVASLDIDAVNPKVDTLTIGNGANITLSDRNPSVSFSIVFTEQPYIQGSPVTTANVDSLLVYDRDVFTVTMNQPSADNLTWTGTLTAKAGKELEDASLSVNATYTDAVGNAGSQKASAVMINVDRVAPEIEGQLTMSVAEDKTLKDGKTNATTINLSMSVPQEPGSTTTYEILGEDGKTWIPITGSQLTNLQDDKIYQVRPVVTDEVGNRKEGVPTTITVDTTAPTVKGTLSLVDFTDTGASNSDKLSNDNVFRLNFDESAQEQGSSIRYEMKKDSGDWASTSTSQSGLADGTYKFRAVVEDSAGNIAHSNETETVTIDKTVPTVSSVKIGGQTTGTVSLKNDSPSTTFEIVFTEEPYFSNNKVDTEAELKSLLDYDTSVFALSEISSSLDGKTWTGTLTVSTDANIDNKNFSFGVKSGFTDAAGNVGSSATSAVSINVSVTQPTVGISFSEVEAVAEQDITVTFTFSEEVSGFTSDDITVTGATLGTISGSGTIYRATLTPTAGASTVSIAVKDNSYQNQLGINGVGNSASISVWGIDMPDTVELNEDSTWSDLGLAVNISDVTQVVVSVDNGILSLPAGTGSPETTIFSNSSKTLTVTGNKASINEVLSKLIYTPAGNWNGDDKLTVTSTNPSGTTQESTTIKVAPAVDPATITLVDGSVKMSTVSSTSLVKFDYNEKTNVNRVTAGTDGSGVDGDTLISAFSQVDPLVATGLSSNYTLNYEKSAAIELKFTGWIYLEKGVTYTFGGIADNSEAIVLGGQLLTWGRWGSTSIDWDGNPNRTLNTKGDKQAGGFVGLFVPEETGFYRLELYAHNKQGTNGSYLFQYAKNSVGIAEKQSLQEYLQANKENVRTLPETATIFSDIAGIMDKGIKVGSLVHDSEQREYYQLLGNNEVEAGTPMKISGLSIAPQDSKDTVAEVWIENIPAGTTISYGTHSFTATADVHKVNIASWGSEDATSKVWSIGSLVYEAPAAESPSTVTLQVRSVTQTSDHQLLASEVSPLEVTVKAGSGTSGPVFGDLAKFDLNDTTNNDFYSEPLTFSSWIVTEGGENTIKIQNNQMVMVDNVTNQWSYPAGDQDLSDVKVVSAAFEATQGSTLTFEWKASNGATAYKWTTNDANDAVSYQLQRYDGQNWVDAGDGARIEYTGATTGVFSTAGETVSLTIDATGTYRLVLGVEDNTRWTDHTTLTIDNIQLAAPAEGTSPVTETPVTETSSTTSILDVNTTYSPSVIDGEHKVNDADGGYDILHIANSGSATLSVDFANITNIEEIHLGKEGANGSIHLDIHYADLLGQTLVGGSMKIFGESGDVVDLGANNEAGNTTANLADVDSSAEDAPSGTWMKNGTVTENSTTFDVYQYHASTGVVDTNHQVLIQQGISII